MMTLGIYKRRINQERVTYSTFNIQHNIKTTARLHNKEIQIHNKYYVLKVHCKLYKPLGSALFHAYHINKPHHACTNQNTASEQQIYSPTG